MEVYEIVEAVDILEYISQYCELEQRQDGEYWGLSPLKDEVTPSFSVNPDIQRFYDFSSGQGGDVLEFVCKYHRCDFRKGLDILKKYANIDDASGDDRPKRRLLSASIARRYAGKTKKPVKESKSVILQPDYMDRYEWNEDRLSEWKREGISEESMRKYQVRYDPFSNRIVFPVRNTSGDIINVCGRTLDPDFKQKGLRKYTYFKQLGILDTIYGLAENRDEIIKKNEIILFEGAKSVMIADSWGIQNTGAILTSHLNPYQLDLLIQLGVRTVFALDAEIDIREDKNIMKLRPYVQLEWVRNRHSLLKEKDSPVDRGMEVFQTLYEERWRLK